MRRPLLIVVLLSPLCLGESKAAPAPLPRPEVNAEVVFDAGNPNRAGHGGDPALTVFVGDAVQGAARATRDLLRPGVYDPSPIPQRRTTEFDDERALVTAVGLPAACHRCASAAERSGSGTPGQWCSSVN